MTSIIAMHSAQWANFMGQHKLHVVVVKNICAKQTDLINWSAFLYVCSCRLLDVWASPQNIRLTWNLKQLKYKRISGAPLGHGQKEQRASMWQSWVDEWTKCKAPDQDRVANFDQMAN